MRRVVENKEDRGYRDEKKHEKEDSLSGKKGAMEAFRTVFRKDYFYQMSKHQRSNRGWIQSI